MRFRILARAGAAVFLAGLVLVGGLAAWTHRTLNRPYAGWQGEAVEVVLEPGLDAGSMLARLGDAGVLSHPRLVRAWLSWKDGAKHLDAGEYRFNKPAGALEVVRRLEEGDVLLHPITLPEGLTLVEIAHRFAEAGYGEYEAMIAVFQDTSPILDLDPDAGDLEGYLFPDTYHFPRGESPERIVATLVRSFKEALGDTYDDDLASVGLTLREAVILASMIERETATPGERDRISRVFHNRLARGMKLECDPTVIYALEREGRQVDRLTYADLRFDSPWNTYEVWGLPAGPIANPGRLSLEAAVRPAPGDELYFVASPDGGHRFSKSHSEHLRAVAAWRRHVRSER